MIKKLTILASVLALLINSVVLSNDVPEAAAPADSVSAGVADVQNKKQSHKKKHKRNKKYRSDKKSAPIEESVKDDISSPPASAEAAAAAQ